MDLTEATSRQHCYCPNLGDKIFNNVKDCKNFQINKNKNFKYDHFPAKEVEAVPWDRLLVGFVGPYKIRMDSCDDPLILIYITMIEPATGWFNII